MGAPQYEQAGADVSGSGTTNTIPRWTGATTLGDSGLIDNGTAIYTTARNFGIGTASPWSKISAVTANGADTVSVGFSFDSANNYRSGISTSWSSALASGNLMGFLVSNATPTGFTRVMTLNGVGQAAIGTTSFTTGRALTTVADLDVFGVRVGRGGNASIATNTAVGPNALNSGSAGNRCTAVGNNALLGSTGNDNTGVGDASAYSVTSAARVTAVGGGSVAFVTGSDNTAVGANALYGNSGAPGNGASNTAIGAYALNANTGGTTNTGVGFQALLNNTTGSSNVAVGPFALGSTNGGSSNIALGREATTAASGDSNQLVLGSATYYVATNGGATTYYATAGALLGYMQIRLNGANVKIPVYAP